MSINDRDVTIRNGKSRDTDIDIHKKKTLEMGQSGMDNLEALTLTETTKKTLEIVQSYMDNLQTLTLTYTRKRR